MYADFQVSDGRSGRLVRCIYQSLILAISTRHADAVDIKFLAGGRPVWISLPHVAWAEYSKLTGKVLTDPMAVEVAGHFLKRAIETGADGTREMYTLTVAETLQHIGELVDEERASAKRQA
jgi:hypothetical protein